MMFVYHSDRFVNQYLDAPENVRKAYDKQQGFLVKNIRHPSLRAKKYDESRGIWQARVTLGWHFYFSIKNDTYLLHEICRHPK